MRFKYCLRERATVSFVALAMLALWLGPIAWAAVPEGAIDEVIDREMPSSGAPGLAYAVVSEGEIEKGGARGVARLGGDEGITPDTPFLIGSITKSFTALAVMQLVEAGELELDAELSGVLGVFSDRPAGSITIRQLLSHTSGFSTLQGNTPYEDGAGGGDALERRVGVYAQLTPAYLPGETWEYSNVNYQILGRLIEVVSGQDYATYVETHILGPIGMAHGVVADGEAHEQMATGHLPWFGSKRPLVAGKTDRVTAPAGGVIASANDLALYMQVMMNGEDDVLSASGKAEMLRPASEASPFYGLGWFLDAEQGSAWHEGMSPGFETIATMVPAEQKGVVVLVNAGSGLGFGETLELRMGITATALDLDYDGEGSRWSQKGLFLGLTIAPIVFLLCIVWAWRDREGIRVKTDAGAFGLFSLWFPLLTTLGGAWIILGLVPRLFGVALATLRRFQPDFVLVLVASALSGVLWAVFRLGVAYSEKLRSSSGR
ncbi:beta-lactamase family protein [Pseudenhygromyxa sp. WMMC2535]|uniref:serine hydrolase domain-containing protein n=1 Tax=Pseudenhygromyxa sp. WMMC2535 TaxID=2712867 RepID=UPI0015529064|nr:serine hydrolase domain-containing protein [Pseudenhygromyxa sp. WMMC2535]NVB42382.1 beta-lactamase family protein [Pseudenhygromyxa sp. WMMC2535]